MSLPPDDQSFPVSQESSVPTGGSPASPAVAPIPTQAPSGTVSQPNHPLTASVELTEPDNKQPRLRQVILKDGRKISVLVPVNPMSLGPATAAVAPPIQLENEVFDQAVHDGLAQAANGDFAEDPMADDGWDDPVAVIEEEPVPAEPQVDLKLVKTAQLVQDVNAFMQSNDVHRFWRRHISRHLHRHLGYNGWPRDLQAEFDKKFKEFLSDPTFVTSCCRKVMTMEFGEAIGAKHVVSFLVAMSGFTAFALCGLDG